MQNCLLDDWIRLNLISEGFIIYAASTLAAFILLVGPLMKAKLGLGWYGTSRLTG